MIDNSPTMLLYIEPTGPKEQTPIIDELTMKMAAAYQNKASGTGYQGQFMEGSSTMGWHTCSCGARSEAVDYKLEAGFITNSLCVHYLAWHRPEVPQLELDKVDSLNAGQLMPSSELLQ